MRKWVVLLIFVFGLLMITWVFLANSVAVMQRIANVSSAVGDVTVVLKGSSTPLALSTNKKVKEGDTVRTGPDGAAILAWMDGTKVHMGPNTELEVMKCFSKKGQDISLFKLKGGEIWSRISKRLSRESKFEVETPSAVAGVRGTIFSLAVTPSGGARLSVFSGRVDLKSQLKMMLFDPGVVVDVQPDGGMIPVRMTKQERDEWEKRAEINGPLLSVRSPKDGAEVPVGTTEVTGRTEPGAGVLVNGNKALVTEIGWFRAKVSISPGDNAIEVVATDRFTFETSARIKVVGTERDLKREQ